MGDTLLVADQKKAYTLTDIGTFLNYEKQLDLKILLQGDPALKNLYSVIAVNPDRFPRVRYREARDFIAFVTSSEGQGIIAKYMKHGARLFNPDAVQLAASSERRKKG
jgi:tungstate transport system substrate-binding protein